MSPRFKSFNTKWPLLIRMAVLLLLIVWKSSSVDDSIKFLGGIGLPLNVQFGWADVPTSRHGRSTLVFQDWMTRRPKEQIATLLAERKFNFEKWRKNQFEIEFTFKIGWETKYFRFLSNTSSICRGQPDFVEGRLRIGRQSFNDVISLRSRHRVALHVRIGSSVSAGPLILFQHDNNKNIASKNKNK